MFTGDSPLQIINSLLAMKIFSCKLIEGSSCSFFSIEAFRIECVLPVSHNDFVVTDKLLEGLERDTEI